MAYPMVWISLIGLWAGLVFSYPAWWPGVRTYPQVPAFGAPVAWAHADYVLCVGLALASLALVRMRRDPKWVRASSLAIVALGILFWLSDLTRMQPWVYQYLIIFTCVAMTGGLARKQPASHERFDFVATMLGGIYFWSGVHKFNPGFKSTYEWLVSPLSAIDLAPLIWAVPVIEMAVGLMIMAPVKISRLPLQKIGAAGAIAMHLGILSLIGPWAHNWNHVVWPWNVAMIAFAWLVFKNKTPTHWARGVRPLALAVFWALPSLNLVGLWNPYFSFALYSGSLPYAEVRSSESGAVLVDLEAWAMEDLRLPAVPIQGVYDAVFRDYCLRNLDTARGVYLNVEEADRWRWKFVEKRFPCTF